jgi:hypothetical protein
MLVRTQEAMTRLATEQGVYEIEEILNTYPLSFNIGSLVTLELNIQAGATKLEMWDKHESEEKKQEILEDYMKGVAIINKLLEQDISMHNLSTVNAGEIADLRHIAKQLLFKINEYIKDRT